MHAWMGMPSGFTHFAVEALWKNVYSYMDTNLLTDLTKRGFTNLGTKADPTDARKDWLGNDESLFDLTDASLPPNYLYARDGVMLYRIMYKFHSRVVKKFYATNAPIENDPELKNVVQEINEYAKLRGFPAAIKTIDELTTVLTMIAFTTTAYNGVMNNQQFVYQGYLPHASHWMYGTTPGKDEKIDETYVVHKLIHDSWHAGWQFSTARLLDVDTENPITKRFGSFAEKFSTEFVPFTLITAELPWLQTQLKALETIITARNADAKLNDANNAPPVFNTLKPSLIPNSVEK